MKFEDLKFERKFLGGFGSTTEINGYILSVQCGSFHYCTPRSNLSSVEDYSTFEIAVIDNRKTEFGEFVTSNFINEHNPDDVAGWVTREEINEVIKKIENEDNR
jgi:ABC-type enterochelin transport system substrate-binding protein